MIPVVSLYIESEPCIAPNNPKIPEATAHMFLRAGKIQEAFVLMDKMSEVGPFFAAKLNEFGVKLSQSGKGKSALTFFKKVHGVVRQDLRYKISINAALACLRIGEFDKALEYVNRCEMEFGSPLEKAKKIRQSIIRGKQKSSADSVS